MDSKELFINSIIVFGDGSVPPEIEKHIKDLAYSAFFGSKRLNALGVKVEDASVIRGQNKRPYVRGKWSFIRNFLKKSK